MTKVSVVVTAYNEQDNIQELINRVYSTFSSLHGISCELVLVDNGSTDDTSRIAIENNSSPLTIKLIELSRNFTYQGGIDAGLCHADGDLVFIIDADLQDPPELFHRLFERIEVGDVEIVYGVRTKRKEKLLKKISFWLFYRLWKLFANIPIALDAGDCCLITRKVKDIIVAMPERCRFLRGQRAWVGFKSAGVEYHRQERFKGETKFSLSSAIGLALDAIYSYSFLPIKLISILGIIVISITILLTLVFVIGKISFMFFGGASLVPSLPAGQTVLHVVILTLFGITFLFLGAIGEYLARIYDETRMRPRFLVKKISKLNADTDDLHG